MAINKYTYENKTLYFNFFNDLYFFSKQEKSYNSNWFYNSKEYNNQIKYNNEKNYINISVDFIVNEEKKQELIEIFEENEGKSGSFWLETYINKIELFEDVNNLDNFVNVKSANNLDFYNNKNKHLTIRKNNYKDASYINQTTITDIEFVKINNVLKFFDYEKIELNNNISFNIIKEKRIITDLLLVRFDQDVLQFNRIANGLYKTSIKFKELIQETP